jgi:L-ribulose-5-phosphate 3-epimerase
LSRLKLGLLVGLTSSAEECLGKVSGLRFPTCQVAVSNPALLTPDVAVNLRQTADRLGIEITTIFTHCRPGQVWNFVEGPTTIGLVPPDTRRDGVERLKRGADFATWAGVANLASHVGFLPENPGDDKYPDIVAALQEVAQYCQSLDRYFCFETGQETPTTLLRTIQDVGTDNLGINLDPANLLMYGKANPIDALDVFGHYVRGVHAKDGEYPTNGRELGLEKPLGEGRVNFPILVPRLKALGYTGALTIEREVSGPAQLEGIEKARRALEPLR